MEPEKEDSIFKFDLYGRLEALLGIDLRSLALFRVGIGIIVVIDLIIRAASLTAHYTDAGVAPRELVFEYGEQPWFLSFHMLSGGIALQVVLFIVTGLFAIALVAGYRSRVACFGCWILMLSLHVRNPFVNNLGDWLLVDLLFWSMFLPLGAKFSIDEKRMAAIQILPRRFLSIATMAVLLQICFVYFFSVRHKSSPAWHTEGTALQFALNLDIITSAWGHALLDLPEKVLEFMTFATLFLEKWGPVFLFFPFFIGLQRSIIAFAFIFFHILLVLFFELGLFPFICITAWILFLPTSFWDRLKPSVARVFKMRGDRSCPPGLPLSIPDRKVEPNTGQFGFFQTLVVAFSLFCILSSGLMYGGLMDQWFYEKIYKHVEPLVNTLNMKQRWDMFSPQPPRNDGWFVVVGYTEEGRSFNLFPGKKEVNWSRPANVAGSYKDQRWRKYLEWVMNKGGPFSTQFVRYCENKYSVDAEDSATLQELGVYLMHERTLSDLTTSNVVRIKLNP